MKGDLVCHFPYFFDLVFYFVPLFYQLFLSSGFIRGGYTFSFTGELYSSFITKVCILYN